LWVSKGQSPLTPSAKGGTLLSSGAFLKAQQELCSVAIGNFAQSFMGKKSKLQIENLFSIHFFAREKVFTN